MKNPKIHPIATALTDGSRVFVTGGGTIAVARWSGDMWAYDAQPNHQINFEPTGWVNHPADFLTGDAS